MTAPPGCSALDEVRSVRIGLRATLALLALAATACGGQGAAEGCGGQVGPVRSGIRVRVSALPKTRYYARCHIRTFHDPTGRNGIGELQGYANQYVIDTAGRFTDTIPSPNAQCLLTKLSGPGDVELTIEKNGEHRAVARMPMRWVRLNVW